VSQRQGITGVTANLPKPGIIWNAISQNEFSTPLIEKNPIVPSQMRNASSQTKFSTPLIEKNPIVPSQM
jgi:hypothetical protein